MFRVVFRGFVAVEDGLLGVSSRHLGFLDRQGVFLTLSVTVSVAMVPRRLVVMVGSGSVVVRVGEIGIHRSRNRKRFGRKVRGGGDLC